MNTEAENLAAALICLSEVVELLRSEGQAKAGEYEGLLAYQALTRICGNAQAFGLSLERIGLHGFDPDSLLNKPRQAA